MSGATLSAAGDPAKPSAFWKRAWRVMRRINEVATECWRRRAFDAGKFGSASSALRAAEITLDEPRIWAGLGHTYERFREASPQA